jgi:hypothetical protein
VEGFEDRALARIQGLTLAFGLTGAGAGTAAFGWQWGVGFLLGAMASWANFHWLKRLVMALSQASAAPGKSPRKRVAVIFGLRYLLLAAGAYAIVNYSEFSLAAALAGLFVAVAAVVIEIVFELIYAGT